ncbi:MAG: hypothetical protein MUF51_05305 [Vicinamibacteria bacterium]|jgi:hypothetical protein|nr:hypothetical protein [Vicinamibacteria bacterium]
MKKPGKIQAIAIYSLVLGIINILLGGFWLLYGLFAGAITLGFGCIFAIPAPILLTTGIFEIVYATQLLATPIKVTSPWRFLAILEICNILTCNMFTMAAGIVSLVFYQDPEVAAYLEQR